MGAITISTHNGSTVQLKHNRRDLSLVEKENRLWERTHPGEIRINLSKPHEIWYDEDVKDAYNKIFGEAIRAFNEKQIAKGHPERCIDDYYEALKVKEGNTKKSKHPLYEIIYQVGSARNPVEPTVAKMILKEIAAGFAERNPNLHVVGTYYHADESDKGSLHIHLTYFPVAYQCSRGPAVQNSLKQALKEQGVEGTGPKDTAQMRWERRENDLLESICQKYGYEVIHPMRDKHVEHLTVEEYKLKQDIAHLQEKLEETKKLPLHRVSITQGRLEQLESIEKEYKSMLPRIDSAKRDAKMTEGSFEAYLTAYDQLNYDRESFEQRVNEAAFEKMMTASAEAMQFINSSGMLPALMNYVEQQRQKAQHQKK